MALAFEPFLVSTGIVALGEIGDKTQLLALLLAARFRRPVPIILGILAATLLNHALAGLVGDTVARLLGPDVLRWVIGLSFLAMAGWMPAWAAGLGMAASSLLVVLNALRLSSSAEPPVTEVP